MNKSIKCATPTKMKIITFLQIPLKPISLDSALEIIAFIKESCGFR